MKKHLLYSFFLLVVLLTAWEVVVRIRSIPELILPTPSVILMDIIQLVKSGFIWPHLRVTVIEIIAGFLIGSLVGLLLGVTVSQSSLLNKVLHPYIIASQAMPKLALAPLFVLWFGYGILPKLLIIALICFFPLFESSLTGLRLVDGEKVDLFRSLKASKLQILWKLRIPVAIPYIFSGMKVAIVLSVVGAVVSEFIGASEGLGALIIVAQGSMDTPMIFSSFLLLTAIGVSCYQIMDVLEKKLFKKYTFHRRN
ncbi:ABC transporter permease [Bacillus seohaeanensis]|jgi:NitT/TauT family transport system permease protein|uniref:ABC transporter permease n=1 Tax=Bacillus seohaeanensis TaxID=284580 RepID=A0ABW5RN27_9BACI